MTDFIIHGTEGNIEGRYNGENQDDLPIVLVMHPEPKEGGNMNSKVVFHTLKAFKQCGFATLTFNFRPTPKNNDDSTYRLSEISDATTALDWIQNKHPSSKNVWVAGFSFGSWVATQIMIRRPEINNFISIGTPVNLYDFSLLSPCHTSGLFIHAEEDEIANLKDLEGFLSRLSVISDIKISKKIIKNTDHFFNNSLPKLEEIISQYVKENLR